MEESKTCGKCGETKPAHGFHRGLRSKDGLQPYCKACRKAAERKRPFSKVVRNAKSRALKVDVPFELTEQYLESIWTGVCPVFQVRMDLPSHRESHKRTPATPSLDRLVPDKGYVPGNVLWISLRANQMKNDGTSDDLFRVAEWLQQTEEEIKKHETD